MKRLCTLTLLGLALLLASHAVFAQTPTYDPSARPMFATLPPHNLYNLPSAPASQQLPQWSFNWKSTYNEDNYTSVILGSDPSKTNRTTTINIGIIPIKMVYGPNNGNLTFDPNSIYSGDLTTIQMVTGSLMFQSLVDYNQGGTDLGTTQYLDAYERGNFWGYGVSTNTDYHLLYKTHVFPEVTISVSQENGTTVPNPWSGIPTGTANLTWFDTQLQLFIAKFSCTVRKEPCVSPAMLPLFITENVYLTQSGSCCTGGYHSSYGPGPASQTYAYATVIQQASVPVFGQDVDVLAHEVGEWTMDPFTNNASPCPNNSILEVGDPLEGGPDFGDFPYTVNGFTYHPQDLVFITWFGAPSATSLNSWNGTQEDVVTFQNESLSVCEVAQ